MGSVAILSTHVRNEAADKFTRLGLKFKGAGVSVVDNPTENQVEVTIPGGAGGGDMLKAVYDTDNDGVVDDSEKLEGSTKLQVQDHAPKAHTHPVADLTDHNKAAHEAFLLGYTLHVQALTSSPVDATTVYFGNLPKAPITTPNISKVYIRKAGTIRIAEIYCYSGTAGTGEAWSLYIRKNNTTDYLIATLSISASERVFSNTGLSIPVVAGDYIEIKGVQPTWATNPATTIYGGYIYIE